MSNIAIGISASASASAAASNVAAQKALRLACEQSVRGYQNDHATVSEMRQYSECVDRIYPEPMSHEHVIILKVVIVVLFVSAILGFLCMRRDGGDWVDQAMGVLVGLLFGATGILLVAGVFLGVQFLFR